MKNRPDDLFDNTKNLLELQDFNLVITPLIPKSQKEELFEKNWRINFENALKFSKLNLS